MKTTFYDHGVMLFTTNNNGFAVFGSDTNYLSNQ